MRNIMHLGNEVGAFSEFVNVLFEQRLKYLIGLKHSFNYNEESEA
jgi:hypothetical protein